MSCPSSSRTFLQQPPSFQFVCLPLFEKRTVIQACGGSARRKGEVSAAIDQTLPSFRRVFLLLLLLSRGGREGKPEAIVIASIIVIIIKIESWRALLHELLKVFFWRMVGDRSKHAPLCTHLFNNVDEIEEMRMIGSRWMETGFVDGWDFFSFFFKIRETREWIWRSRMRLFDDWYSDLFGVFYLKLYFFLVFN